MPSKSVQDLIEDVRLLSEDQYQLVQAVRGLVKHSLTAVEEVVKYGGILFASDGVQFGGMFAYRQHVTVEFGRGADIVDPFGHLEGTGKGRRHVKLRTNQDIEDKRLMEYLKLALRAARGAA